MSIDTTAIMREVESIIHNGEALSGYRLQCSILANEQWINPPKIDLMTLTRNYETAYGDVRVLQVMLPLGVYTYRVLPYRDDLTVDLTAIPVKENGSVQPSVRSLTTRYRAVVMDQNNQAISGRSPHSGSESDLDLLGLISIELQLLDEGTYQTRMITTGNNYQNSSPMDVLKAMLSTTLAIVDGSNRKVIHGITVAPGYNTKKRSAIIVPHGTPVSQVASYIQNEEGGVYPTGLGCYLQSNQWWLFPLYDVKRYKTEPRAMTIFAVPPNRYMGAERTYRYSDDHLSVIAAGDIASIDTGLYQQLNHGNSVRFAVADQLLKTGSVKSGVPSMQRSEMLYEVQQIETPTGMNNTTWGSRRATDNPYREYSEAAKRNGMIVTVDWNYGDISLIYPGMPVKYITNSNGKLLTLYGTVLGAIDTRVSREPGVIQGTFLSVTTLRLFLGRMELS